MPFFDNLEKSHKNGCSTHLVPPLRKRALSTLYAQSNTLTYSDAVYSHGVSTWLKPGYVEPSQYQHTIIITWI